MSIRNLDALFDPASVAVIGASTRPGRVGSTVWRNLRHGGYAGTLMAVNPNATELDGIPVAARVQDLPQAPELAVICTPPATVPGLIAQLGAQGTRAAVVMTAGLTPAQKQAMLDAARVHLLRIVGPNCLGLLAPHARLNASFSHVDAAPGTLAFISQSGALATSMLDWARGRGVGFSTLVSLGERSDVDFGDLLDWLASDARTRAILLYIESIEAPRKFMSAARAAARNKPVIVVKAGRSTQGAAAAASHTGALASADIVFDAAIRRAGMLRVDTLQDLFVAAEVLSHMRGNLIDDDTTAPERLTLVTNGGGAGVMAADAAAAADLDLAELPQATRRALDAFLPANWSRANPVDIIGDAPVERYVQTLQALLESPETGTLVFMHSPTAIVPSADIAAALLPLAAAQPQRIVAGWIGGPGVAQARERFQAAGVPSYDTPEQAVQACAMLATYRRNQALLRQAPSAHTAPATPDLARIDAIIGAALAEGREMLTEPEAKALMEAAGIPVTGTRVVGADADEAVAAAAAIGYPVVLKILSPDISHKSDVGGVVLRLEDEAALRHAVQAMLARVQRLRPDARIAGFTVQSMVIRPQALELIIGSHVDPLFGPVILFGQGGTAVEVVADRAVALPPLNEPLAKALIARTRIARLLAGWRDVPAADQAAVVRVLTTLSQLLADEPRIAEIDINPLLADAKGVIALDARVRVAAAAPGGAARFSIRPYPSEQVETLSWREQMLTLRPIRPEDEAQHLAFLERLEPIDIRMRVFYSRRSIEPSELARLTQVDYERELAFVATQGGGAAEETLAVARATIDPDNVDAEFGIVVRSDLKGGGLGELLMHKLIRHLRERGTQRLVGIVLRENARMRDLARVLGFAEEHTAVDADSVRVVLPLR
ncbi:MAG: bifunctional acetate--CoA ligase family protein/GNAT family N-acetyltransferase [Burkholderiales bacterium]|nr:bifunctional acetate--CoA ligase family protein/GNAT family N-acetyltransferase [Burkholderiales bacterium]